MNTRKFALGGVAALALAFSASQLVAQTTPATPPSNPAPNATSSMPGTPPQDGGLYGSQVNSPQYSSPAAKEKTKELNQQGVSGTTASPAVLNGQAPASQATPQQSGYIGPNPETPPPATPQSSIAAPMTLAQTDAQQQYRDQQQQYQAQQQQYQDQQQQYQDQKHRYYSNLRQYDQARWNYVDYPHVYAYEYDDSPRLQRLYLIAEPSQQLANVPVEGPGGVWVGRVRNVEPDVDGRPRRLEISLNHRVSVWASPGDFRYDPVDHVLFTDMPRDAFWQLPGARSKAARCNRGSPRPRVRERAGQFRRPVCLCGGERRERGKRAAERNILGELRAFGAIRKIPVKHDRRRHAESRERRRSELRIPSDQQGRPRRDFEQRDDGQEECRHLLLLHVGDHRFRADEFRDPCQNEQRRQQSAAHQKTIAETLISILLFVISISLDGDRRKPAQGGSRRSRTLRRLR